ncbi:MAG: Eco57I restriction-modification methylase domain-containing protein, partial [Acidobacteriota bacterium]
MTTDIRQQITKSLEQFKHENLKAAATDLLYTLGYKSDKILDLDNSPTAFLAEFDREGNISRDKALVDDWKSIDLLFQLTDEELSNTASLFPVKKIKPGLMRSYLFFAIELKEESYPRGKLARITRQINRVFPMPVMVIFEYDRKLSIAVINRRRHKKDEDKDVLGKVTLIHDISLSIPHRGHLDILASFSMVEMTGKTAVHSFDELHEAWEQIFNIELLNKKFYKKIQEWFFWAVREVRFPHGGIDDEDQRNRIAVIRLLTRIIFCWFAQEKELIPAGLFDPQTTESLLKNFQKESPEDSNYYNAVLQNLFFAVLNTRPEKRRLRRDHSSPKGQNDHYMDHSVLRYRNLFKNDEAPVQLFDKIPFLNGGLFDCLDYREEKDGSNSEIRVDGFSDVARKQAFVPNILFFGEGQTADLSKAYHSDNKADVRVDGLFTILNNFKFTVTENTPIEQEIALDPELLGRIFENLLAEYNPETEKNARNESGSFYTPRTIVDYMVSESLKAYLENALLKNLPAISAEDAREGLEILFSWTERDHAFNDREKQVLLNAIYEVTILDPACGSGAFPMGMLQKLVYVLEKLDHGHDHWKKRILDDTPAAIREETRSLLERTGMDFQWKMGLIQRCIYGVDIQPIAVQIAKLRCFVALLVDFRVDGTLPNFGVPALPNLDFKFVAADTLIKPLSVIERGEQLPGLEDPFYNRFSEAAEEYFFVKDPGQKADLRIDIEKLIEDKIDEREGPIRGRREKLQMGEEVFRSGKTGRLQEREIKKNEKAIAECEEEMSAWESYRNIFAFRNSHVKFFDARYFFPEIGDGFDIVIGNPPYVQIQKFQEHRKALWVAQQYKTYKATADIYCLFYERGAQLLKPDGHLCYITSNKWMRADYGKNLREFLASEVSTKLVMDFGMTQNFGAATTYTCILAFINNPSTLQVRCCYASDDKAAMSDPGGYFEANSVAMPTLDKESWVILSPERYRIKRKVEKQGIPLEEWDLKIYRGILTGLNEAFYLTREQRDELIAREPQAE